MVDNFLTAVSRATDFVKTESNLVIVSHYDADGLTSGAIASKTLDRLGKEHVLFPVKKLDEDAIKKAAKKGDAIWFVDLGSGQLDVIESIVDSRYLVCDHHETISGFTPSGIHLNAHNFGWDGAREISGAGMTYLVSKYISDDNMDLSAVAIVGAVGDMQDSGGSLVGKNRDILSDGINLGVLARATDLRFFGRYTRPIVQFISYASEVMIPGLTGNDTGVISFLNDLGIPIKRDGRWLTYMDLSPGEKSRLLSGLYVYALRSGVDESSLKSIIGEVYELVQEKPGSYTRDAKDFATLLNACGRHGEMLVGIQVAKGDRGEYYDKSLLVLKRHRHAIKEAIQWALDKGLIEYDGMYLLDGRAGIEDSIIGIVAGMLYNTGTVGRDKPIIAISYDEDGKIKVSGRGNWDLVKKGLHLGVAMREVAESMGAVGGGHNIAAGATIEKNQREEFLSKLSEKLKAQIC